MLSWRVRNDGGKGRWLVGWLVGWFAGWLAGWLVGWLVGRSVGGPRAECFQGLVKVVSQSD